MKTDCCDPSKAYLTDSEYGSICHCRDNDAGASAMASAAGLEVLSCADGKMLGLCGEPAAKEMCPVTCGICTPTPTPTCPPPEREEHTGTHRQPLAGLGTGSAAAELEIAISVMPAVSPSSFGKAGL